MDYKFSMLNFNIFKLGAGLLFIFLGPWIASSQDYIPTIGEGKEWELNIVIEESQTYPAYYFTACDTIFNGLSYKSIIRKTNGQVIAYTREDVQNQQVYYLPLNLSAEILVLDYSLEAGDTFILRGYPIVVQSVTTETIFGEERTVLHFPAGIDFIEGVGHSQYGILNWLLEGFYNTVTWIKDDQATCEQITFTSEPEDKLQFIFPNPVADELILDVGNADVLNMPMALFTMQGALIKNWSFQNKPIDMSYLASGIYFLKISDKTFKVIKL